MSPESQMQEEGPFVPVTFIPPGARLMDVRVLSISVARREERRVKASVHHVCKDIEVLGELSI